MKCPLPDPHTPSMLKGTRLLWENLNARGPRGVKIHTAPIAQTATLARRVLNDLHQYLLLILDHLPKEAQTLPRQRIVHQDRKERLQDHADAGACYAGKRD